MLMLFLNQLWLADLFLILVVPCQDCLWILLSTKLNKSYAFRSDIKIHSISVVWTVAQTNCSDFIGRAAHWLVTITYIYSPHTFSFWSDDYYCIYNAPRSQRALLVFLGGHPVKYYSHHLLCVCNGNVRVCYQVCYIVNYRVLYFADLRFRCGPYRRQWIITTMPHKPFDVPLYVFEIYRSQTVYKSLRLSATVKVQTHHRSRYVGALGCIVTNTVYVTSMTNTRDVPAWYCLWAAIQLHSADSAASDDEFGWKVTGGARSRTGNGHQRETPGNVRHGAGESIGRTGMFFASRWNIERKIKSK